MRAFPQTKSFDTFDFAAQPSLNKALVLELMRCEWIDKRENCLALGPSGTGKTHAALGLGLAACQKGHSVAFTTAAALVHELMEARDERCLRALQKHLNTVKLLIVDELGYVPFTAVGSELLFEVFSLPDRVDLHRYIFNIGDTLIGEIKKHNIGFHEPLP